MRLLLTISTVLLLAEMAGQAQTDRVPRTRDSQVQNQSSLPDSDPRSATPESKEKSLKPKDRVRLQPSSVIEEKYPEYLKRSDGGLFVLLDPEELTVSAANSKEQPFARRFRGGGSYYSFITLQHDADNSAQIKVRHNSFQAGTSELTRQVETEGAAATPITIKLGKSLALFVSLGDRPLEELTADVPAARELAAVEVPSRQKEFDNLITASEKGIEGKRLTFRSTVPAKVNNTYLLRTVIFRKSDHLIVFRVVDRDRDGNLHIIWRRLAGS